jgi:hypothetical protein
MALPNEMITYAGSGIVFNNTYDDGVTPQVRNAIVAAENYLQAHFTDTATINVTYNYVHQGAGHVASNHFLVYDVSYAELVAGLGAHATTSDDRLAVAGLPLSDPSHGAGFVLTVGQAQALGLRGPTGQTDVTITINADQPWTFGSDLIGAVEHELTEGGFGRVQSLGVQGGPQFFALDLFRFTQGGLRDFTGGADGQYAVFGVDGAHLTDFFFHNAISTSGQDDGHDLADWDFEEQDAFGPGGGGDPASISGGDLQVLDVIGWTPSGAPPGSGPDDFADSFTDATHPFGQLTVGADFHGTLQAIRDRDWFKVTLSAGTDYVIYLTGQDGGGGTLEDPVLRLHDAAGVQLAINDDANFDTFDARLIFHATTSGTYFVNAGSTSSGAISATTRWTAATAPTRSAAGRATTCSSAARATTTSPATAAPTPRRAGPAPTPSTASPARGSIGCWTSATSKATA